MDLWKNEIYQKDLSIAVEHVINIKNLYDKSVLITGAAGLIGSYLVDMLLYMNNNQNANIKIYALGRSLQHLKDRFLMQKTNDLIFVEHDVNDDISFDFDVDYIIHAASNAYPATFNNDPVGTILSNVVGTNKLLEYAKTHDTKRLLYISSGEVYGQGDINIEAYAEDYSGYVNPLEPRSCYPASKRTAENLCVSYTKQFGVDTVIARPCHTYGPNATSSDNRANVQFVNDVLAGHDIVLKSTGDQLRSYCYIADCTSAILSVMLNGQSGEAYNIAYEKSQLTIAEFAQVVAELAGREVIFKGPSKEELESRSPISKQVLNSQKIRSIGWQGCFTVKQGVKDTLTVLQDS